MTARCSASGLACGQCKQQRTADSSRCHYHDLLASGALAPAIETAYVRTRDGWIPKREVFE